MDSAFYFSTGRQSRKAKNLATNSTCVIATENSAEAVVLEGVARETPDLRLRRKFIRDTERKYSFDNVWLYRRHFEFARAHLRRRAPGRIWTARKEVFEYRHAVALCEVV